MTGTSLDGADCACVEFLLSRGKIIKWKTKWSTSFEIPTALQKRLLEVQLPEKKLSLQDLMGLESEYSHWLSTSLDRILSRLEYQRVQPHALAIHGQTIAHHPNERPRGQTLQILNPHLVATQLGIPVVHDFRRGDIAAQGQGAPLVPLYHFELLKMKFGKKARQQRVALHNLGGISNLTALLPSGELMAWDTGPGNCWIDETVRRVTKGRQGIDFGGALSSKGRIQHSVVDQVLAEHDYFRKSPPKSTGRDEFPYAFFEARTQSLRGEDLVATATEVTARSLANDYVKFLPLTQWIYFFGGGAKNATLLQRVRAHLPHVRIETIPAEWGSPEFMEAEAFAYFGIRSLLGLPLGGTWTGAKQVGSAGSITPAPGKPWIKLIQKLSD